MLNRRRFLQSSTGAMILGSSALSLAAPKKTRAQRLLIGAQTNVYGVALPKFDRLLEVLDTLKRLGYDGFETSYLNLAPHADKAASCRRAFESRHIQLISPHCSAALYDREKADTEIEDLKKVMSYSAEMGATQFVVSGSKVPNDTRPINMDAVHNKTEGLNRLGRACQEAGLKLAYHNH